MRIFISLIFIYFYTARRFAWQGGVGKWKERGLRGKTQCGTVHRLAFGEGGVRRGGGEV